MWKLIKDLATHPTMGHTISKNGYFRGKKVWAQGKDTIELDYSHCVDCSSIYYDTRWKIIGFKRGKEQLRFSGVNIDCRKIAVEVAKLKL